MINTRELNWSWQGQDIVLGLDEAGSGPVVLLCIKASLLPRGKLSIHEEFPDDVAKAVEPFLSQ